MASLRTSAVVLYCLALALALLTFAFLAEGVGGRVGGRKEIEDVKTNKEVQDLGRFSVEEYNRERSAGKLKFREVVEAQSQVVSGIKYYLKIWATDRKGVKKMFDSEVVVKPWLQSKKLLNFSPSTNLWFVCA